MGADVIKVERPGVGDITRGQLRDVPNADSLYFTMLNGNKRSITIDSKHPKGMEILNRLIKACDVLVENFAPGALDRMGLTWEYVHKLNPRMIVASVKGFGPGPYEDCKVYENVAQCAGGAASTTGFREGPPLVTGAQIGDSGTGLHLALGIVSALYQRIAHRPRPEGALRHAGRRAQSHAASSCATSSASRTARSPNTASTAKACRSARRCRAPATIPAAASRAGCSSARAGRAIPTPTFISSPRRRCGAPICDLIGEPTWKTDPDYATPKARLPRLKKIFARIEEWTMTKTKFEVMDICNEVDIPVGPILSMKEIAEDESLRKTGTVVEVDHPTRGKYLTVGNPIKLSDSPAEVERSPLLGEHTEEILTKVLGYNAAQIAEIKASGAITPPKKEEKAA